MIRYWDLPTAVKELERRLGSIYIQKRVREICGDIPVPSGSALLARHLPSARLEEILFKQRAESVGLQPILGYYSKDRFTPENPSKRRLVVIRTFEGFGRNGGIRSSIYKICDIESWKKTSIDNVLTFWGESLLQFHVRAHRELVQCKCIDFSSWLAKFGTAMSYYLPLMLGACSTYILFESFESPGFDNQLEKFKNLVVVPAIKRAQDITGVEPLIVYHPSEVNLSEEVILNYYLSQIKDYIPARY